MKLHYKCEPPISPITLSSNAAIELWLCLGLIASGILARPPVALAQSSPSCGCTNALVVGGFDSNRGGAFSFPAGDYFAPARAALAANFTNVVLTAMAQLDSTNLASIDLLIICSPAQSHYDDVILSADEQAALVQFVQQGKSVILCVDNSTYAPTAPESNQSFLEPLGMAVGGTLDGYQVATVPQPSLHPITNGRFGLVQSFTTGYPGILQQVGAAQPLASFPGGAAPALAVFDPGVLAPGSGSVTVFSDADLYADMFGYNSNLFLNNIVFSIDSACRPSLSISTDGQNVILRWPNWATNYILENASSLTSTSLWSTVSNLPTPTATGLAVTNSLDFGSHFYRLRCSSP